MIQTFRPPLFYFLQGSKSPAKDGPIKCVDWSVIIQQCVARLCWNYGVSEYSQGITPIAKALKWSTPIASENLTNIGHNLETV